MLVSTAANSRTFVQHTLEPGLYLVLIKHMSDDDGTHMPVCLCLCVWAWGIAVRDGLMAEPVCHTHSATPCECRHWSSAAASLCLSVPLAV